MSALCDRIVALVVALGLAFAGAPAAYAQGNAQAYEAALAGFTADSFNDTDAAISAVAASGNPLAAEIIEALQDGRLRFSPEQKKVYFRDKAGAVREATTGATTASPPNRCSYSRSEQQCEQQANEQSLPARSAPHVHRIHTSSSYTIL